MMRGAASTGVSPARGTGARLLRRNVISTCSYSQVRCPDSVPHLIFIFYFYFGSPLPMRRVRRVRRRVVGGPEFYIKMDGRSSPVDGMWDIPQIIHHTILDIKRILDLSSFLDVIHRSRWHACTTNIISAFAPHFSSVLVAIGRPPHNQRTRKWLHIPVRVSY